MWSQISSLLNYVPGPVRYILMAVVGIVFLVIAFAAGGTKTGLVILIGILVLIGILYLVGFIGRRMERRRNAAMESVLGDEKDDLNHAPDQDSRRERENVQEQWEKAVGELKSAGFNLYTLPWYMLLGEPAGGKSTTLRSSGLEFPVGAEAISGVGGTRNCDWWFTNEAVILDTAGRFTFDEKNAPDQAGWIEFLNLLKRFRARCPVNGVIIAIPCTSLLEDSADKVEQNALKIKEKLQELQRQLEIQFPVWVLVTKADKLFGFTEFFSRLPAGELRRQLFGWSNPDAFDKPVDHGQWPTVFGELRSNLKKWRNQFLEDDPEAGDVDRLYAFPDEFAAIESSLELYMKTIFSDNRYVDPVFLRGFYFTSGIQRGAPILNACSNLLRSTSGGGRDEMDLESLFTKPRAFFIRDFYRQKVFKEQGMIRPTRLAFRRRRVVEKIGYSAVAVISISLLTALIYGGVKASSRASGLTERIQELGAENLRNEPLQEDEATAFSAQVRQVYDEGLYPAWLGNTLFPGSSGAVTDGKLDDSYRALLVARNFESFAECVLDRFTDPEKGPKTWSEYEIYRDAFYEYVAYATGNQELPAAIGEKRSGMRAMCDLLGLARDGARPLPEETTPELYNTLYLDLLALRESVGAVTEEAPYPDLQAAFQLPEGTLEDFIQCFERFYVRALDGEVPSGDSNGPDQYEQQYQFQRLVTADRNMRAQWIEIRKQDLDPRGYSEDRPRVLGFDRLSDQFDPASAEDPPFRWSYNEMAEAIQAIDSKGGFADFSAPSGELQKLWEDQICDIFKEHDPFEDESRRPLESARTGVRDALRRVTGRLDFNKEYFAFVVDSPQAKPRSAKPKPGVTALEETLGKAEEQLDLARNEAVLDPYRFTAQGSRLARRLEALDTLSVLPVPTEVAPLASEGPEGVTLRPLSESFAQLAKLTRRVVASAEVFQFCENLEKDRGTDELETAYRKFRSEFASTPTVPLTHDLFRFQRPLTQDLKPETAAKIFAALGHLAAESEFLYEEANDRKREVIGNFLDGYRSRYRDAWEAVSRSAGLVVQGKDAPKKGQPLRDLREPDRLEGLIKLLRSVGYVEVPDSLEQFGGVKSSLEREFRSIRESFPLPITLDPTDENPEPEPQDPVDDIVAAYRRFDNAATTLSEGDEERRQALSPSGEDKRILWTDLTALERLMTSKQGVFVDDLSKGLEAYLKGKRKEIEELILDDYKGHWVGIGETYSRSLDRFPFQDGSNKRQVVEKDVWIEIVGDLKEFDQDWLDLETKDAEPAAMPFEFMKGWIEDVGSFRGSLLDIDRFVRDDKGFLEYEFIVLLTRDSTVDNVTGSFGGVSLDRVPRGREWGTEQKRPKWDHNRASQPLRLIASSRGGLSDPWPPIPPQGKADWSEWLGLVMFIYTFSSDGEQLLNGGFTSTVLKQDVVTSDQVSYEAFYDISWSPQTKLGAKPIWQKSRWTGIR